MYMYVSRLTPAISIGDQALGISVPRSTVEVRRAVAPRMPFLQRRPRGIRSRRLQGAFRMNLAADLFHAIADCLPVNIQADVIHTVL